MEGQKEHQLPVTEAPKPRLITRRDFLRRAAGLGAGAVGAMIGGAGIVGPKPAEAGSPLSSAENLRTPEWNSDGAWFYDGFRVQVNPNWIKSGKYEVKFNDRDVSIEHTNERGSLLDCFAAPDGRLYITRRKGMPQYEEDGHSFLLFIDQQGKEHLVVAAPYKDLGQGWAPLPDGIDAYLHRSIGFYRSEGDSTLVAASFNASTEGGINPVVGISRINPQGGVEAQVEFKIEGEAQRKLYEAYLEKMGVPATHYEEWLQNRKLTAHRPDAPSLEDSIRKKFGVDTVNADLFYFAPVLPRELKETASGFDLQLKAYEDLWGKRGKTVDFATLEYNNTTRVAHFKELMK